MKSFIPVLAFVILVAAAPERIPVGKLQHLPIKLRFRNLYKNTLKSPKPGPRIINGHEAKPHSIPYQAFLTIYNPKGGFYCGGSLISENYILTAGQCGDGAQKAEVVLGAHSLVDHADTEVSFTTSDITVHEDYDDENIVNDVAVFKLPSPVSLNYAIQPVKLPSRGDASNEYVGTIARASVWGLTDGRGGVLSKVLNYVDVEVISNQECEETFGPLENSTLCTSGENNSGICDGDFGGPLTVDGVQIGVVSFGALYCPDGIPSGFSRVTSFLDWIQNHSDVVIG